MSTPKSKVRAIHCDHRADEEQVYAELVRLTAPLDAAWAKLKAARRIGVKFNQAWPPDQMVYHEGQLVQLVSEKVARAMWLKYVDPDEAEGEHFEVYERALAQIREAGL